MRIKIKFKKLDGIRRNQEINEQIERKILYENL